MTTFRGYMVEADWDGETLTARGTNKMGQVALRGEDRDQGDVQLPKSKMTRVEFKDASRIGNGHLVIHAEDGKKYQLHFRRKQAEDFRRLAQELDAL